VTTLVATAASRDGARQSHADLIARREDVHDRDADAQREIRLVVARLVESIVADRVRAQVCDGKIPTIAMQMLIAR
jgi:hypothetical protein